MPPKTRRRNPEAVRKFNLRQKEVPFVGGQQSQIEKKGSRIRRRASRQAWDTRMAKYGPSGRMRQAAVRVNPQVIIPVQPNNNPDDRLRARPRAPFGELDIGQPELQDAQTPPEQDNDIVMDDALAQRPPEIEPPEIFQDTGENEESGESGNDKENRPPHWDSGRAPRAPGARPLRRVPRRARPRTEERRPAPQEFPRFFD